jgi:hypothetical protein
MNKHIKKMIGRKFGKLTIISHHSRERGYNCKCDCGKMTVAKAYMLTHGKHNSCGCVQFNRGTDNPNYRGIDDFSKSHYWLIKYRAIRGGRTFNLSMKYLWELFKNQNRKCKMTGWPLQFGNYYHKIETTASLDRIDSKKGYIKGNVQWLHKDINKMKLNKSDEEFINMCHAVSKNFAVNVIAHS